LSIIRTDSGKRFEIPLALHLLKPCHLIQDREGFGAEVHDVRDRTGRGMEFLVAVDRNHYRVRIPWAYHVTRDGEPDFVQHAIRCRPARQFLGALV